MEYGAGVRVRNTVGRDFYDDSMNIKTNFHRNRVRAGGRIWADHD